MFQMSQIPPQLTENSAPQQAGQKETPVVAFPLRGTLNPYLWYLLPLLLLSIAAFVLTLLALIAACVAPSDKDLFAINMLDSVRAARIVAIILYAIVLATMSFLIMTYTANLFNFFDSKYSQIFFDILVLVSIFLLVPISVLLIVSEDAVAEGVVGYNSSTLLVAGILGLCAAGCLIAALFFSRFYEFCIGTYKNKKAEVLRAAELAKALNSYAPEGPMGI